MRTLLAIQLGLIFILGCSASAAEQDTRCNEFGIRVIAPGAEFADQICTIVLRAKSLLESCHLSQQQPFEIRVQPGEALPGLLAHFSPQNDQIVLPTPITLFESLAIDSAYRVIPKDHLFDSFVVHEMTHAFFAKTKCGLETCRAGHEYVAYALQLNSLPERSRALFLAEFPTSHSVDIGKFSDFYLDLKPERFAADAWYHFSKPGNGCDFIRDIVSGKVTFPSEFE